MVSQAAKCSYVSPSGTACQAYAVRDGLYCYYHDPRPETVAKRQESLTKGSKRARARAEDRGFTTWISRPILTMEELKISLSELFNAGMSGEITTARLSSLASVANALGKVIEQSDLEKRIEALELKAKEMKA